MANCAHATVHADVPLICQPAWIGNPARGRLHDTLLREIEAMFRSAGHHHHEPPGAHHTHGRRPDGRSGSFLPYGRSLWYHIRTVINLLGPWRGNLPT